MNSLEMLLCKPYKELYYKFFLKVVYSFSFSSLLKKDHRRGLQNEQEGQQQKHRIMRKNMPTPVQAVADSAPWKHAKV